MTHKEFAEHIERHITRALADKDFNRAEIYGSILELMRRSILEQEPDNDFTKSN